MAKLLSHHGVDRWRFFYQYYANLWTPDQNRLYAYLGSSRRQPELGREGDLIDDALP